MPESLISVILLLLLVVIVGCVAQCASDWTVSSVTDVNNNEIFSIDRTSGKTTIKTLDSALVSLLLARIDALEAQVVALKATASPLTTFTIWGTSACPSPSTRIFDGLVIGPGKSQSGGGADLLCAPFENGGNVQKTVGGTATSRAFAYNAEFNTSTAGSTQQPVLRANDNFESRCASCEVAARLVSVVVGRRQCFAGWTVLYSGVLMAAPSTDAGRVSHICMLEPQQGAPFGLGTLDGGPQLSVVEFRRPGAPTAANANSEFAENPDIADLVCAVCFKR